MNERRFWWADRTNGYNRYDEKSDIYALGCTLYEIITMRSVYDDQSLGVFPVPIPKVFLILVIIGAGKKKLTASHP